MSLPKWITDRKKAPHVLRVGLRTPALPAAPELAAFTTGWGAKTESDAQWLKVNAGDGVLLFVPEEPGPEVAGFPHHVLVESTSAKFTFLAAYFTARRCGGVVWVQKKAQAYASTAFADLYLGDEDLEWRWERVISGK